MSGSYDVFLSYSGAQEGYAEHLNKKLAQVCGHYSVFFDKNSMKHGERVCTTILEHARTFKLAVVLVSEEYFTRSRWPMLELATIGGSGIPSLLPVFFDLDPNEAMNESRQAGWWSKWQEWDNVDKRSEKNGPSRTQPLVWKEAVDVLLDTSGLIFSKTENENAAFAKKSFLKKVAKEIVVLLDVRNKGIGPLKTPDPRTRPYNEGITCTLKRTNKGPGSVNVQILGNQRCGKDIACMLERTNGGNGPVNVQILKNQQYKEDITRTLKRSIEAIGSNNVLILGSQQFEEDIAYMLERTNRVSNSLNVPILRSQQYREVSQDITHMVNGLNGQTKALVHSICKNMESMLPRGNRS